MRIYTVDSIRLEILKSSPPQLSIQAQGHATSGGWSNPQLVPLEKTLSADGILDIEFVATPPKPGTIVTQGLAPVCAELCWKGDVDRLVGVRIVARTNELTELLFSPTVAASIPQTDFTSTDVWPWPWSKPYPWPPICPWPPKGIVGETAPDTREKLPFGEDWRNLDSLIKYRDPFGRR